MESENTITAYNGEIISCRELVDYLSKVVRLIQKLENNNIRLDELKKQIDASKLQAKRRRFPVIEMAKPCGLSSLSRKKMKEYQQWLDEAPRREKEQKYKEEDEDRRIEALNQKICSLKNSQYELIDESAADMHEYRRLTERKLLPPDYYNDETICMLYSYLKNGRAFTLQEAVNLYHHEMQLKYIADMSKSQAEETRKALCQAAKRAEEIAEEQRLFALETATEQYRQLSRISEEVNEAKSAAESAELFSFLNLCENLRNRE